MTIEMFGLRNLHYYRSRRPQALTSNTVAPKGSLICNSTTLELTIGAVTRAAGCDGYRHVRNRQTGQQFRKNRRLLKLRLSCLRFGAPTRTQSPLEMTSA